MDNFVLRRILGLRQNYWFWPSAMTVVALILGFVLPFLDAALGADWVRSVGFLRATQVEGARAILTTLAGATLGVAGVAFSVTIVAVSFASANYGPRLIGNFMGDRTNQIVLGVFVATFVYCITVLSTVHGRLELGQTTQDAFVPQMSVFVALMLTLVSVGALIGYIHHIPESINIMNVTALLGQKLYKSVTAMLDGEGDRQADAADAVDVSPAPFDPPRAGAAVFRAQAAGYLQQVDIDGLTRLARAHATQVTLHRAPGDFLVSGETVMSAPAAGAVHREILQCMRNCHTQGTNRTDAQDVLFLSDQLVEVLGRALSPGVNDPHTAMLCLDWLRAGLMAFACRPPPQAPRRDDPVLYRRISFEVMLDRSFDRMRQYVAADRTVTLHALGSLAYLATMAERRAMTEACIRQIGLLAAAAGQRQAEAAARAEIEAEVQGALRAIAAGRPDGGAASG